MLDNNTIQKLHEMKLGVMASSFRQQLEDIDMEKLSFEERFGLIIDAEWATRKSNRLTRLIRGANFDFPGACLEDIDYRPDRELDKALITRLSTCNYVQDRRNLMLLGASGSGKTWIACAFGVKAAQNFYTVRYVRLPDLLGELAIAKAEGTYRKVLKQLAGIQLLVIDEWLLYELKDSDVRDILELVDRRHKRASTIFCSQFDPGGWHEKLGEPTIADAICDRIVHDSYTLVVKGEESMRKHKGLITAEANKEASPH
jgi:DNA replication protein DnaC